MNENIQNQIDKLDLELDNQVKRRIQEILDTIDGTKIVYFMKTKYFDFTDLDNPVKFFIREEQSHFSVNHTKLSYMTLK